MSSETSTSARRQPGRSDDSTSRTAAVQPPPDQSLQPWQFFVLAALGCATAVTFLARGRDIMSIILLSVMMGSVVFVGLAALRAVRPLVSPEEDRTPMIGQRTRVALEREKMLALRSIKELEFDRAMGKLSDEDWREMSGRLRARAARLIRQLDAGVGYRAQIERELETRLDDSAAAPKPSRTETPGVAASRAKAASRDEVEDVGADEAPSAPPVAARVCSECATANDADARFCKNCGAKL